MHIQVCTCASCCTWHVHRAVLLVSASDAQLAIVVVPPALDAASSSEGARVQSPQNDGYSRDT